MAHNISQRKRRDMALALQLSELPRGVLSLRCLCGHEAEHALAQHDQTMLLSALLLRLRCDKCQGGLKRVALVRPVAVLLTGPGAFG